MDRRTEARPAEVPERARQAGEAEARRERWAWVEPSVWTDRMLAALEDGVKGEKWFSLIDKVYRKENLLSAFKKVKRNQGAGGVDHETVAGFEVDLEGKLAKLSEDLRAGTYQSQAARRAYIEKPGSKEKRPLGIPTVRDRVCEGAFRHVLEPIFEREFADNSHGFRPGRNAKDALRQVERGLEAGKRYVVDADIQRYFDTIPHDRLMLRLAERIADGRVMDILRRMLERGVLENREKTRIVNLNEPGSGFDFLGYHVEHTRKGKLDRWPRKKSLAKLKDRLRGLTHRANGQSLDEIIMRVNRVTRGWFVYFQHSNRWSFLYLDGWIRGRLRAILRKRAHLRGRGRGRDHQRWSNLFFANHGYFQLSEAHVAVRQSAGRSYL